MRLIIKIALTVLMPSSITFAQDSKPDKFYLTNAVSLGLGISSGVYKDYTYLGQNRTIEKAKLNFTPEYHITAGFILKPALTGSNKTAFETGLLIGNNTGSLLSNTLPDVQLTQSYWGIPVGIMFMRHGSKSVTKYGAGASFITTFYKEVAAGGPYDEKKEWSFSSDERARIFGSLDIYFKRGKRDRYWGLGLHASQELNGSVQTNKEIPFSLRNTRISFNIYPFLWFFS